MGHSHVCPNCRTYWWCTDAACVGRHGSYEAARAVRVRRCGRCAETIDKRGHKESHLPARKETPDAP